MPIAPATLQKAVRNNPIFAQRVGWKDRYQQISQKIGFSNMSPGPEAFAEGVFHWQATNPPLKADGILGPKTWEKLEPQTRFTASTQLPEWLRTPPPLPEPSLNVAAEPEVSSNAWFGLSIDFGGHAVLYGRNTMYAQLYSMDTYQRRFRIESERNRFGPGLGGGVGISFLMITGLESPGQLQGKKMTGLGFQVALGARWGEAIKNASKIRKVQQMLRRADDRGGTTRRMVEWARDNKQILTEMSHDEWFTIAKQLREASEVMQLDVHASEPSLLSLGIPTPGAVEVSAYWESGNLRIFGIRT